MNPMIGTYSIDLLPLCDFGACPASPFLVRLELLVLLLPEFVKRATDTKMVVPAYGSKARADESPCSTTYPICWEAVPLIRQGTTFYAFARLFPEQI